MSHPGGALLLFHRPPGFVGDASNVYENIEAFDRCSRFPVWEVNTAPGFPSRLAELDFDAILLHYSLFASGPTPYFLDGGFLDLLDAADAYKLATFQDEHHWCGKRFAFIDEVGIDCVYTMLESPYAERVYLERTGASRVVSNLPGYVGPEVIEAGRRFAKPEAERSIDLFYRGRPIAPYMGRGIQEKYEIGERFAEAARDTGLALDVRLLEEERLYGDEWYRRMADSKGALGTESGASYIDLDDEVRTEYERLAGELGREPTIDELERGALGRWEGNIPYRTISPRHFEAAALGVCQILYEGRYSGLMEPMRHYIPLKKDFSNLDQVIERFRDPELRAELTANARRDLIDSGAHTYERFIAEKFDPVLEEAGVSPPEREPDPGLVRRATRRRPARPLVVHYVNGAWHWLGQNHPVAWRILHLASRPVVVPARQIARALSRIRPATQ